jgi:hypothetical protein
LTNQCYGCKFAKEARDLPRQGEQVKCAKAEELFGGERWVDVRRSKKTGKLLKAKCGEFQPFIGDQDMTPEETPEKSKARRTCSQCNGTGQQKIKFINDFKYMNCTKCDGEGNVEVDTY